MNMNTIKRVLRECNIDIKSINREIGDHLDCPIVYVTTVKGYEQLSEEEKDLVNKKMPYDNIGDNDLCFIDNKENLVIY